MTYYNSGNIHYTQFGGSMMKARRRVKSLEPQWRFCFPALLTPVMPGTDEKGRTR